MKYGLSPSPHNIAHTKIHLSREHFEAAVKGDFTKFADVQDIGSLLTPKKNSILHVHLTSTTTAGSRAPESIFVRFFFKKKVEGRAVSENFVEQLIDKCEGLVLLPNAKGETPLHLAARFGHSAIARLLLERAKTFPEDVEGGIGAEIKLIRATIHEDNQTALHDAARYNHIEVVELILEMDPAVSSTANVSDESPLYIAAERKHKLIVKKILEKVEFPAYLGHNGRTALHAAVINNDLEMTGDFMKNEHLRAMLKHADQKGWAPLHYVAENGDNHLAKLLLDQDEDTGYMQDGDGRTALHIAAHYGRLTIMKLIMEYCPDCSELVDNKGWNVLHYALNGKSRMAAEIIVQNLWMSNLYNEKDVEGCTPLHLYAKCPYLHWHLLVSNRFDLQALNKKDQTALDVACDDLDDVVLPGTFRRQGVISHLRHSGVIRSPRARVGGIRSPRADVNPIVDDGPNLAGKEATESRLIVATLIATVTFAAAITPPGGIFQDGELLGRPVLGYTVSFKAFMAFDTMALVMSVWTIFIHFFLPLVKRSKWLDYYLSDMAFSFLLIAIATFMLAFITGTYVVLGFTPIGFTIMMIGLSSMAIFKRMNGLRFGGSSFFTFIKHLTDILMFICFGPDRGPAGRL